MSDGLDKLAGAIGDSLKTAPTIYEDALQPAVQEIGKFTARIPRAINAAFSSLDKWILNKEYAIDETKKLLEKKLENVEPEKIVTPEAYVAVPAIQAISYSMDSKELRNLYANLLAKAMNIDTKDMVHPSFIEIIKQLSPEDVILLNTFIPNKIYRFEFRSLGRYESGDKEFKCDQVCKEQKCIPYINYYSIKKSLNNLLRLNLIVEYTGKRLDINTPNKSVASVIKKINSYCEKKYDSMERVWGVSFNRIEVMLSFSGTDFFDICVCNS